MNKFVFTCGDINGIGPEIVIKSLNKAAPGSGNKFYFICPGNVFEDTASYVKPEFDYEISGGTFSNDPSTVSIINIGNFKLERGRPTKHSGEASFKAIKLSYELTSKKSADAVVTAPISKAAVNSAGFKFPGHTEMYAGWCNVENFVMTFLSRRMNAALVTIHDPISKISGLISAEEIEKKLNVVIRTLREDLNIGHPKVAVLGLNPHAGEEGLIGTEEVEIIRPLLKKYDGAGETSGPFSPDAFFANRMYKNFDLVLGMYHDQVLIPFKLLNFGAGVNFTAGLPIIRTSPDHGVAYDIASEFKADESSFLQAYKYAERITKNRKKYGRAQRRKNI